MRDNRSIVYPSPLCYAASNGKVQLVSYLIDNGANVNLCDSCYNSPFEIAILFKHFEVAYELIKHGADPDLRINDNASSARERIVDAINGKSRMGYSEEDKKHLKDLLKYISN